MQTDQSWGTRLEGELQHTLNLPIYKRHADYRLNIEVLYQ
jgi:hypothetical protein